MATLTTSHQPPQSAQTLTLDSLPLIDLASLSQSELQALSLCSPTAYDLRHTDDLVIPSIDASVFNESAGSHRQTFSRPSPNDHHYHHHHPLRHRLPGLLPVPKPPPSFSSLHDPETLENRSIISALKSSLKSHPEFADLNFTSPPASPALKDTMVNFEMKDTMVNFKDTLITLGKRKRGRKPRAKVGISVEEREPGLEIVNKNGVAVDLERLGSLEDPFGEELRRRTEGMVGNEEALLGFMRDLGGQWCSRRRKRKIVDANIFGDALPVGWKLLLGLKRREGRASVYCRRYISPGGRHFLSCKEVSTYLQSYFAVHDADQPQGGGDIEQVNEIGSHAGASHKDDDQRQSNEHQTEGMLLEMDNLADVQIHDLFECHKCNMTFDDKDTYLQHLLSFHQRTTRRYRLGSSVGDGVIVRDGKFECQFCHKVFQERRRYNGHVGIHVRNFVRGIEDSPGQLTTQKRIEGPSKEVPARISRMDALIEIAQSSILETTNDELNAVSVHEPNNESSPDKLDVVSKPEVPVSNYDPELNSESPVSETETEDDMIDQSSDQDLLYQQKTLHVISDEKMEKIDDHSNIEQIDSHLDSTISLSTNIRNDSTTETSGKKDGLALNPGVLDKSVEQEGRSDAHLLASSMDIQDDISSVPNTKMHPKPDELDSSKSIELHFGFESYNSGPTNDVGMEIGHQTSEENVPQSEVPESSVSLLHQPNVIPASITFSDKGEDGLCSSDQRHDNASGFDEDLRLDDMEQFKFSLAGQESPSLPEVPIDLATSTDIGGPYGSSIQFESEVALNTAPGHQLTTVCVWCGVEFNQDNIDSDLQSDSVGYMCPTCKAKIPG
ncbi:hypothetical protein SLEP1_g11052 [Rubroshorea leprosula]|uniref:Uncharacterized protein n=1 Tax=Rubroshorea leprosula TaxID=152421 RepID=A0AAV5IFY4_9ROSI|nr:hypothetical protein SLEP1_g11052 [Rubroshorea leprosula]